MYSIHYFTLLSTLLYSTDASARSFTRANQCGVVGWETNTDAYFYDDSGKTAAYAKCSQHCLNDTRCKSLAIDGNTCLHFDVSVTGNFQADKSSTETFYDRGCLSSSSSSTTTTTTKTTAVTSSSTTKLSSSTTKSTTSTVPTTTTTTTTKATTKSSTTSVVTTSSRPSTSTTIKTTSSSTSSPSSTAVTIPPGCNIPSSYTVTSFSFFNSSHNLDCVTGPDIGDGTGCIDANSQWCDPKTNSNCTNCGIAVCSTGLPPQPLGYGPPDDVKITLAEGSITCEQLNPAVVHRYEVGEGFVNCGGAYNFMNFYGSSNAASSTGRVEINGYGAQCADGETIVGYYDTNFPLACTRDAQRNATCGTTLPFSIPIKRYTKAKSE